MKKSDITTEIWDLLNADSWLKNGIAETGAGQVIHPKHPKATKFSLIGGLTRCYLDKGEIWNPLYERKRSTLIAAILSVPELKHIVTRILKYQTTKKIPLQEMNARVDYDFIRKLMAAMQKMEKGP